MFLRHKFLGDLLMAKWIDGEMKWICKECGKELAKEKALIYTEDSDSIELFALCKDCKNKSV